MRSKNNAPTAAESRHMGKVAELGCIVHQDTPAEVHHATIATPRDHCLVIPLCTFCHQFLHADKHAFEGLHGSELKLIGEVNRRLSA